MPRIQLHGGPSDGLEFEVPDEFVEMWPPPRREGDVPARYAKGPDGVWRYQLADS